MTDAATATLHLTLYRALDGDAAPGLRQRLLVAAQQTSRRVTLDMSEVTFIDGAGIGALAFLYRRLAEAGRELVVTGASGQPLNYLRGLGLARVLGIAPSSRARRAGVFGRGPAASAAA